MKLKYFACMLVLLELSCSIDYDSGKSFITEPERIIVNSFLNPNKPMRVQLHQSKRLGSNYIVCGITNAHIILKENGATLFEGISADSVFTMDYFPKEGMSYSIIVSYDELQTVSAQTHIPKSICAKSEFSYKNYWEHSNFLFTLSSFDKYHNEVSNLWITSYQQYENKKSVQYNEIYANNILIDKTNSVAGMGVKNEVVGSIYYEGYIRIKNKNIPLLSELIFTPNYVYGPGEVPGSLHDKIQIRLISASPEYDKYNKTLYDQKFMIVYDDDISAIFYQPKGVYSNIKNGLGIFAGMNETNYVFELPKKND